MDLSAILPFLSSLGPWGVVIGGVLVLLVQRLNIKLPTIPLPSPPSNPAPTDPAPAPVPVSPSLPDLLGIGDRPVLKLLFSLLALKSSGTVTAGDASYLDAIHKEIGELKANLPK